VWGGISARGATKIVMFTGTMNAIKYGKIIEAGLVPFIKTYYPMDTGCSRIMIQSTPVDISIDFSSTTEFIGGNHLRNRRILIQ